MKKAKYYYDKKTLSFKKIEKSFKSRLINFSKFMAASAVFATLIIVLVFNYFDTPEDIRDKYQYYTEANMNKLRAIGYSKPFTSLEHGVEDYVKNYLIKGAYY